MNGKHRNKHIERYYVSKNLDTENSNSYNGFKYNVVFIDLFQDVYSEYYIIEVKQANNVYCDDVTDMLENIEDSTDTSLIERKEFMRLIKCEMYLNEHYFVFEKEVYERAECLFDDELFISSIIERYKDSPIRVGDNIYFNIDVDKKYLLPSLKNKIKEYLGVFAHANIAEDYINMRLTH